MVGYRRNRVAGGTYFFTVVLHDRASGLLTTHIDLLRKSLRETIYRHPTRIEAMVILPDHLHCIWTLPPNDDDYPARWKMCKSRFSQKLHQTGATPPPNAQGEYPIWQRRYWERTIRDDSDLRRCIDYIHFNPVKHGHAQQVAGWPYSSFHRFVRAGLLPADWGGGSSDGCYGE